MGLSYFKLVVFLIWLPTIVQANHQASDTTVRSISGFNNNDTLRVNMLNKAAYDLSLINSESAKYYATEALELAYKLNYTIGAITSLRMLGLYYEEKSEYKQAEEYYLKALDLAEKEGFNKGVADAYNDMGKIFAARGDYGKAYEYYQESLRLNEELKNIEGVAMVSNNMGNIYLFQGDYDRALQMYSLALEEYKRLNDSSGIADISNNIGIIYEYTNDNEKALEYYLDALAVYIERGEQSGIASTSGNIANIYLLLKDFDNAMKYYQEALQLSRAIGKKSTETYAYVGLANYYLEKDNPTEAYQYSTLAYENASEIGNAELLKQSAELLAKCSELLGRYQDAYNYQLLFKKYSDSLVNKENVRKVTALEIQYRHEKQVQEEELLRQQEAVLHSERLKRQKILRNTYLIGILLLSFSLLLILRNYYLKVKANKALEEEKRKVEAVNAELNIKQQELLEQSRKLSDSNEQLQDLNSTKNKFFSIIAHDLRNTFNFMMGTSALLLKKEQSLDAERKEKIYKELHSGTKRSYLLFENLLTWASSQSGRLKYEPENILVYNIIREAVMMYASQAEAKSILLENKCPEDIMAYADPNMMQSVFRNLISNALKFTNKDGRVSVKVKDAKESDFWIFQVMDNGIGISSEKKERLFKIDESVSEPGTENEKGSGLGLILCKDFVSQNGGEIWVENDIPSGTSIAFTIPKVKGA